MNMIDLIHRQYKHDDEYLRDILMQLNEPIHMSDVRHCDELSKQSWIDWLKELSKQPKLTEST